MKNIGLEDLETQRDFRLLECWLRSPHVVQWWGNSDLNFRTLGQRSKDTHALITVDGRPVGYLCWQRPLREELEVAGLDDLPEDLVDIDILIGEQEYLGCGVGSKALALLLARLGSEGVGLAGLGTSISNRAAIRASEKAGFRFFKDFEEPGSGPCAYMVAQLPRAVERLRESNGGRSTMDDVILKRFEAPDEVRQMPRGRFEIVRIGGVTIGRATYEPGWRWSVHVGPGVGAPRCTVEHVGFVVSGNATAAFEDGSVIELRRGTLFHIPARPHDSWVIGDEPYVSLHFLGAEHYAK